MSPAIRPEKPGDGAAIHAVHVAAFPTPAEADLVDRLRGDADSLVSLVAEEDRSPRSARIVGHILVTRVFVDGVDDPSIVFGAIGPVGVLPECQGRGVGAALNRAAIEACRAWGMGAVFVLGDPAYYARFGFERADAHGVRCAWEGTEDAFRVVVFDRSAMGIADVAFDSKNRSDHGTPDRGTPRRGSVRLARHHGAFDVFG